MSEVLSTVLMIVGAAFALLAGAGVVRMPDLFMRMQAATKASTLGIGFILLAVAVYFGELGVTTRALATITFVFLTTTDRCSYDRKSRLLRRRAALGGDHHRRVERPL